MIYKKLGKTSLDVSLICLGTMTWGQQNSKIEAFEQMDYAFKRGINFFDKNVYEDLKLFVKKSLFFLKRQEILNDSKDLESKIIELFLSSSLNKKKYSTVRNRHIVIFENFFCF